MSDTLEQSIEILEANYIPYLHEILEETVKLFDKALQHKNNCLISNTVGTVSSSVGGIIGLGALLASVVFTGGVAAIAILGGIGLGLGAAGSITSLGTVAASRTLERSDKNVVQLLLDDFNSRTTHVLKTLFQFLDEYEDYAELFPTITKFTNLTNLTNFGLLKDEKVTIDKIRHGDHIIRPIALLPLAFHHGINIRRGINSSLEVIDYGPKGVRIRPICKFLKGSDCITRRNYNCLDLSISETVSLIENELSLDTPTEWRNDSYNASRNCEHFASFLKVGRTRSRQIHAVASAGVGTSTVAKVGQCSAGIVSLVGKVTANSAGDRGIAVNIAVKPALITPRVMQVTGAVAGGLAPVLIAADIGLLVYEFRREKPNLVLLERVGKQLEETLDVLNSCLTELRIRQVEAGRSYF